MTHEEWLKCSNAWAAKMEGYREASSENVSDAQREAKYGTLGVMTVIEVIFCFIPAMLLVLGRLWWRWLISI